MTDDNIEDELSQIANSNDEDGIVNFLSDAIGQDVGTEVLREFSNSDAFAELMDVVTSSLTPLDLPSRRLSQQSNDQILSSPGDYAENADSKEIVNSDFNKNEELEKESSSSNWQTIQSQLNVCVKPENKNATERSSRESKNKCRSPMRKVVDATPPETKRNFTTATSFSKKQKYFFNQAGHESCRRSQRDADFITYAKLQGLSPCCVVVCDLLNMGSIFRQTDSFGGGGDPTLSVSTVKNLVILTDSTVDELELAEVARRNLFLQQFKARSFSLPTSRIEPIPSKANVHVTKTDTMRKDEPAERVRNTTVQAAAESPKPPVVVSELTSSPPSVIKAQHIAEARSTEERAAVSSSDDSDFDIVFKRNKKDIARRESSREKSSEKVKFMDNIKNIFTGNESDSTSSTDEELRPRSKPINRLKDHEDVRAKKFDKFRNERQRKLTDTKKERVRKKDIKAEFKPEDPFSHGKTLASSFRIPKKNTGIGFGGLTPSVGVSTPLAKQDIPAENLKFERCKKGTEDEKDRSHRKSNWTPREKRFENASRFKPDRNKKALPPLELKAEIEVVAEPEPTWEDEPAMVLEDEVPAILEDSPVVLEDEPPVGLASSGVGNESVEDSSGHPLSKVRVGDLALEVTGLLRDGIDLDIQNETDLESTEDSVARKCAWWFNTIVKDPLSLNEVISDASPTQRDADDNHSITSFLGNVSNPSGEENDDKDCQVNEISSSSPRPDTTTPRDPDNVDEFCVSTYIPLRPDCEGRALLQAKIRTSKEDSLQNIFDLRSGAQYDKENFQAKCNLCSQLIVGKRELAVHVQGLKHKASLMKIDGNMDDKEVADKEEKHEEKSRATEKVKESPSKEKHRKIKGDIKKELSTKEEKKIDILKDTDKEKCPSRKDEKLRKKGERRDISLERFSSVKKEPVEMEEGRTSTGLKILVPVSGRGRKDKDRRSGTRSPTNRMSKSRNRSRSKSRDRKRRSRSPVRRIPRSPLREMKRSRPSRSRSRSPQRPSRKIRLTSEERVNEFLLRTRRRSRSPKRSRRSRTRSRSPPISFKKDNREFMEKMALIADGKWTDDMEMKWKMLETEEAIFNEQRIDQEKRFLSAPEEHPKYADEWTQFWERRYQEIEQAGKDPDTYDFVTEWKEFWDRRLKILLQEEAASSLKEIKRKYKMDFESLNKIRKLDPNILNPIVTTEQREELGVEENEFKSPKKTSHISESGSYKAMSFHSASIPTSGVDSIKKENKSMEKSQSVSDPKPPVTVEDFKSKWEALTREKVNAKTPTWTGLNLGQTQDENKRTLDTNKDSPKKKNLFDSKSDVASSSDASYDFDGFDLVQVLRLMCKLEDQLSFLAPKVVEYFKQAEEMELAKSRGSHKLLDNEELVALLFQSRDRFMTMIRSNVVGKEVLSSLNLTVYALNAILEAPQCQKHRPPPVDEILSKSQKMSQFETLSPKPESSVKEETLSKRESSETRVPEKSQSKPDTKEIFSSLSPRKQSAISHLMAQYLLTIGRENLSDLQLKEFVTKLLDPVVQRVCKTLSGNTSNVPERSEFVSSDKLDMPNRVFPKNWDPSAKMQGVTGTRVIGSALPSLSATTFSPEKVRGSRDCGEPPTRFDRDRSSPGRNGRPRDDTSRERSPSASGRSSPFSRRDYTGNPIADKGRP